MTHAKYVSMKVNKNLQYQNVDIKYVYIVFNNYGKNSIIINVLFADKQIGTKKSNINIDHVILIFIITI